MSPAAGAAQDLTAEAEEAGEQAGEHREQGGHQLNDGGRIKRHGRKHGDSPDLKQFAQSADSVRLSKT